MRVSELRRGEGKPDAPEPFHGGRTGLALPLGVSVLLGLAIVGSVSRAGLWDPPELEVAELSRRIAHGLLGAEGLGSASDGPVPTRGELGRGELPFTSIALGFTWFGLSPWAGRLPLALWGVLGLVGLHLLVRRLHAARAAWLAVLALGTAPLYFLHARTMLGDVVGMAAGTCAMAALGIAVFDRMSTVRLAIAWVSALVALAAGLAAAGPVLGVAVPTLGVGIAWLTLALAGARQGRLGDVTAMGSLGLGAAAAAVGTWALLETPPDRYSIWVGAFTGARELPTFEVVVRNLGHSLFPWSAVVPWAAGRLLTVQARRAPLPDGQAALRVVLMSTACVALVAHGLLAPFIGALPFVAPAALTSLAVLALLELDEGAPPSRALGLSVGATALLLLLDFRNLPEKALVPFGVVSPHFPESFATSGFRWLLVATLLFAVPFFFLVQEARAPDQRVFRREEYLLWPRALRRAYDGNLLFGVLVLASALVGFELLGTLSDRVLHLRAFDDLGELSRVGVRAAVLLLLGVTLTPTLVLFGRDLTRLILSAPRRLVRADPSRFAAGFERGTGAVVLVAMCGAILAFGFYPELMRRLSPERTFAAYHRFARPGEALALVGTGGAALRYQTGEAVEEFASPQAALPWLVGGSGRRFLVLRAEDLPSLNAGYRAHSRGASNLPILESHESESLLAVSRLAPGQRSVNPLDDVVLAAPPRPRQPLDVNLADKLDVLGWTVTDASGNAVDSVVAGTEYELVIYYRVTGRLAGGWQTFVHIDGQRRRFNGDHPTLGGKYPLGFWQPGDYLADRGVLRLEPNFAPGRYHVYFGLFAGSRRLEVRRGVHDQDRVVAGFLVVR